MSEHDDLFSGFSLLEPSAEESACAVLKTRDAILAAAVEQSLATDDVGARLTNRSSSRHTSNDKAPFRRFTRYIYAVLATAASVLAVCFAVSLVISRPAFAWADMMQRMVGARSLHCITETKPTNGDWVRSWEISYDEQRGFELKLYDLQGLQRTEIDNGHSHWVHRRGQNIATRQSTLSAAHMLEGLFNPLETKESFQPDPEKDDIVDGSRCRCLIAIDDAHRTRHSVWIDENKRLRREVVDRLIDGRWSPLSRVNVRYDIAIDDAAFAPHFEANVKVVDLGKLFDEVRPLDKAVYREEKLGYIFAIHELKRLGDYEYYMLISFRPTDQTRMKLALQDGEVPGHLFPTFRATLQQPVEQETTFPLAKARANGIEVSAYFGELRGFNLPRMSRARPKFQLNAHAKLWNEFGAFNDILFDVPLPDKVVSRDEVVRTLYDMISTLEAVPTDELFLNDPLDDREFTDVDSRGFVISKGTRKHMPKPSEISFEAFLQHLQRIHADSRPKTTVEKE